MSYLWFRENPELFQKVQDDIKRYPTLRVVTENEMVFIRGGLQILNKEKTRVIDSFSIEIELPENFPKSIPIVREKADRIPKIAARHNPNGVVCLLVPEDVETYYPEKSSIVDFIEKCVKPFFIGQSFYEEKKEWLFGERPHGLAGIFEHYKEKFGEESDKVLANLLIYLGGREIKGHWPCYCDSGKKLRNCHMPYLIYYRSLYQSSIRKYLLEKGLIK